MIAAYVTEHSQMLVLALIVSALGCFVAGGCLYRSYRRLVQQEHAANQRRRSMQEEFDRRQREQHELFVQEEEWLHALLTELRAKGIDDFCSADDEIEADAAELDEEMERVLGTPTALNRPGPPQPRSIWLDEPQWDWPKGTDEFEFVHLPTGTRGSLWRSQNPAYYPAWNVTANLPRSEAIRRLREPRTFAKRTGPDWYTWLSYSRVPSDQPDRAIFEAKQWLLAALRGEIDVTEGSIVPTPLTPGDFVSTYGTKYWRSL